jgi:hypothetical protein
VTKKSIGRSAYSPLTAYNIAGVVYISDDRGTLRRAPPKGEFLKIGDRTYFWNKDGQLVHRKLAPKRVAK